MTDKPNLPPSLLAKIKSALQTTPGKNPDKPQFDNLTRPKQLNREIGDFEAHPKGNFPTAGVSAALVALDVQAPENYIKLVEQITALYLEGKNIAAISQLTGVAPEAVKAELNRIDRLRQLGVQSAPGLEQAIVNAHLEIVNKSNEVIQKLTEVADMVIENVKLDLEARKAQPLNGKLGIRGLHLSGLSQLAEAIGSHQDRIGEIAGVLKAKDNITINQNNLNVSFNSEILNKTVDELLASAGQVPVGKQEIVVEGKVVE